MTLIQFHDANELHTFLGQNTHAVVTFSAHWCGPCNASKPQLEQLARDVHNDPTLDCKVAIAYESDLGDHIHEYRIRAFPTYVRFQGGQEAERVEGVNIEAVRAMCHKAKRTGGETLGGGQRVSPEEARLARLAKLGGDAVSNRPETKEPQRPVPTTPGEDITPDVDMPDADAAEETETNEPTTPNDPLSKLDAHALDTLTKDMEFPLIRAQKGLLHSNNTLEGAIEWISNHQDDPEIDEPIRVDKPMSYKCNECGKILSNMANLELHANKTGHSDFEESIERVEPLTEEQKKEKIAEIKELLKNKRAEREETEKVERIEREKQRRMMGKEMSKTREELDKEQRKREIYLRKKEKEDMKKERERIRAELAKDRAERQANKGKLHSKLDVEGYNPSAIQYDVEVDGNHHLETRKKKIAADSSKIDEYIEKVSSYRAGGDGGKALKVLKAYVGNVVDNPDDKKYKTINMENKVFKTKLKPLVGAKNLLIAVGFQPAEDGESLVLQEDADRQLLSQTNDKLEKAINAYHV